MEKISRVRKLKMIIFFTEYIFVKKNLTIRIIIVYGAVLRSYILRIEPT